MRRPLTCVLVETLVREEGKTIAEAEPEVGRRIDAFEYYAWKARDIDCDVKPASDDQTNLYSGEEPLGWLQSSRMTGSSSETYRDQGESGMDFSTVTKTVYLK